jgi:hypothetical protein
LRWLMAAVVKGREWKGEVGKARGVFRSDAELLPVGEFYWYISGWV